MTRFKVDDFPPHVQSQIRQQLAEYDNPITTGTTGQIPPAKPVPASERRGPNKTEAEYRQYHLRSLDARYEALTFRLANGHRYTPDWIVFEDGRPTQCHECKGSYALHSQQRARLAFDQARVEFHGLRWFWAVKTANGWEVTPAPLGTLEGGNGVQVRTAPFLRKNGAET